MNLTNSKTKKLTTVEVAPQLVAASGLCSAAIIQFTVPQIVQLSVQGTMPLPSPTLNQKMALFTRSIAPQTAITALQFVLVRKLREQIDFAFGAHPVNLSLAYGAASVPFIAGKYNMLTADVYAYFGRNSAACLEGRSRAAAAAQFWKQKIQPGFLWSFMRDSGSVGGGIVLGPLLSLWISKQMGTEGQPPTLALKFTGGVVSGSVCGLATQFFHNVALTAGRMAEFGTVPSTMQCMQQTLKEHGLRAAYLNFPFRVAIIAGWSAVLNVADPFSAVCLM